MAALVESPPTTARCSYPTGGTAKPSTRHSAPSHATPRSAERRASRFVTWRPRESIPRGQRDTMTAFAAALITWGYSSSRPTSVCCFESFRRDSARRSASDSRSRSNSTAAATSGPASEPRPASSAPAMKRRSKDRSNANRRRPLRTAEPLERPDPLGRPVREERFSDDPFLGDGSPCPAIVAFPTVVAHHKKVVRRNRDLPRELADLAARIRPDVRLFELLPVDPDPAADHLQVVAWETHHALDEVRRRLLRRGRGTRLIWRMRNAALIRVRSKRWLEDHDVAAPGIREVHRDLVDEHALVHPQGGHHRCARDAVRLDDERLDRQGQTQGDYDDGHELYERARSALLLALSHGAVRTAPEALRRLGVGLVRRVVGGWLGASFRFVVRLGLFRLGVGLSVSVSRRFRFRLRRGLCFGRLGV